jgi:hypothetical protein
MKKTPAQAISVLPSPSRLFLALLLTAIIPIASAHHGFGPHYDRDKVVRIEGTVKQFDFINPHGFLYIDTIDDAGEPIVYVCELQARTQLIRKGADKTLFTVGESIVVEGFASRRHANQCEFGVAHFADGSSFIMRSIDQARSQFADNEPAPLVEGADRTIFGTWIRPGMFGDAGGRGPRAGDNSITAAGEAAVAAFDPITGHPAIHCRPGSPVRSWSPPGLATDIRQDGDKVIIYHESMDVTRTVYLDVQEHPTDVSPSEMGHSIGRFDGDYLLIDTSAFSAGVLVGSTLHTEQMVLHERLSITEDTNRLLIEWTMIDPAFYAEPLTGSQELHSTNKELIQYDCNPEPPINYE